MLGRRSLVVLWGRDQGANNVLDLVEKSVKEQGIWTLRIPGLNSAISEEHRSVALHASAVVLGVSGNVPEAKFAYGLLAQNPKLAGKIVFIEDFPTSNGTQDPLLRSMGSALHLCAILPSAPNAPELSVYRQVHTVGYPDHWIPAIENIRFGIEARKSGGIRKRRRGGVGSCFVGRDEVIIYVSGFSGFTAGYLRQIMEIEKVLGVPVVIHYRAHPSEQNRPELSQVIKERDALLEGRWEIANQEISDAGRDSDPRLIGVSDITVANPGHVSTFFAGSLRKKMVCIMEFLENKDVGSSSYDYRFAGFRTHLIESFSDLLQAVKALLDDGSPESKNLAEKQRLNTIPFDPQNPPSYGKNVVDVIKNLI
ncbi:MAG: hypothetical protein A2931_02920 [Candidatus Niyogibacteria bacterium RIFCSPLOWO2_01_FULL_45_48]|uniref:Uncharacterized protein n=3 Tax=Parcubacteria group TaxID=1794811 RepID=A0A1G2EZZ8_9BACT|nr:MAG: hypothetical protein A3B93_00070 [Candidatus Nomurabacteria bacterium RIFCSPHIGHO2_02_FULL_42_24]OGZ28550.1 MAG: hypothetical protein A2835_00445 [Candidatus Niyogibacteria bacterium RIFCSPHIGHO2_01_FULL_45_28]OGZ31099.1 MAG: hypothetical protein A2931_02920 [Candidatus Niyogibacteria bacterium RIFCSPLOWO2_01_FULL_45_48]OGZ31426.1 MAG: hypothetical protein A3J00_02265 [Candidatus Niyogibacteria bacterium RIFCSPLOWO2_02_FULL_45_13]